MSGDGEGLVDLAAIGALDGDGVVLYSASLRRRSAAAAGGRAEPNSVLVVTDSEPQARPGAGPAIRDDLGATERVDETALDRDESDNRLELFPDAGTDAYTVVRRRASR